MQDVGSLVGHAELAQDRPAKFTQWKLVILILPDALQPVVPRVSVRSSEEIVDDEELQIEIARQFEMTIHHILQPPGVFPPFFVLWY